MGRRLPWGGSLSGARGVQTCPFSRRVGGLPGALPRALQQGIEAAGAMPAGGVHPFPAAWSPPDHCSPVSLTWGHQLGTCHARAYFYTLNPRKDLKWTRKQDGRDGASTLRPHSWVHLPSQPQAPDAPPSAPPRAQEPKRLPDRKAERISLRLCPRLPGPLLPVRPSPRGLAPLPVVPCGASPLRPLLARALEACSSLGQ